MSIESLRQFKNRHIYGSLINQHPSDNHYLYSDDGVVYGIDWNTGLTYFVATCRGKHNTNAVKGGFIYGRAFENII